MGRSKFSKPQRFSSGVRELAASVGMVEEEFSLTGDESYRGRAGLAIPHSKIRLPERYLLLKSRKRIRDRYVSLLGSRLSHHDPAQFAREIREAKIRDTAGAEDQYNIICLSHRDCVMFFPVTNKMAVRWNLFFLSPQS